MVYWQFYIIYFTLIILKFANDLTRVLIPVCSTTGTRDPVTSALHIILGKKMSLDIAQVVRWKTSPSSTEVPSVRYAASFAGYVNLFLNSATRHKYVEQISKTCIWCKVQKYVPENLSDKIYFQACYWMMEILLNIYDSID